MKISVKHLGFLTVAGMLAITACNSDSSSTATTDSGTVKEDTKMRDTSSAPKMETANADQAAIDVLVPGNAAEMAWLMAGINNGTSKEVKEHAKMMLEDHKKLGEKVGALVAAKKWNMPVVDTAGVVNLVDPKGKAWDKGWADKMVADHAGLLDKLNQFETSVTDADLKKVVTDAKPVVQSHLDMAKALQSKMQ